MLRFLVLFLLVWLTLRLLEQGLRRLTSADSGRRGRRVSGTPRQRSGRRSGAPHTAGDLGRNLLVACSVCGVRFPVDDNLPAGEPAFCSDACRSKGGRRGGSGGGEGGWAAASRANS